MSPAVMLKRETKQTTYWLYGLMFLSLVNIVLDYSIADQYLKNADVTSISTLRGNFGTAFTIAYFGSIAIVGRWIYRAASANKESGIEGLKYTPLSCLWWFAVPVMNLWKPYFALKEHYLARLKCSSFPSTNAETTFRLWWASFLAFGVLANSSYSRTYTSGEAVTVVTNSAFFSIASGIALILSSLALIKIMRHFSDGAE